MNKVGKNIEFLSFLLLMIFFAFLVHTDSSDFFVSFENDVQNTQWITNPDASGRKEKAVLINNRRIRCVLTYDGKQNKIRVRVLFWLFLAVHKWKDSRFSYYVLKSTLEKCRKSKCRVCVRRGPPISEKFVKTKDLRI